MTTDQPSDSPPPGPPRLAQFLSRLDRLWSDIAADSAQVKADSQALYKTLGERFVALRHTIRATPRALRLLSEAARLLSAYRWHAGEATVLSPEARAEARAALDARAAERLYELAIELRGGVLKVGQFAASRMDLLPPVFITSLARLQDRVPPVPADDIRARIAEELGAPVDELFASFEDEPIAAASLAQVHGAVLPDGRRVAVKVQLPGIDELVEADMAAMRILARSLGDMVPELDLPTVVDELGRSLSEELDYRLEAARGAEMAQNLADHERVRVPAIVADHSTARILTMERIDGQRLTDYLDACVADGDDGRARLGDLMTRLLGAFAAQFFTHGLVQADPHPGNFLVEADGTLVLLDFGSVVEHPDDTRGAYRELVAAVMGRDHARSAELLLGLGFRPRNDDDAGRAALVHFADLLLDVFRPQPDRPISEIDPRAAFDHALALARENPVRVPHHFVLVGRVLATLGGMLVHYRPDVSLFALLAPHLAAAMATAPTVTPPTTTTAN